VVNGEFVRGSRVNVEDIRKILGVSVLTCKLELWKRSYHAMLSPEVR
jgi:hypothetical protein